ncbi:MAG TPA: NAD(P)-dependent oxidoreductase, partial [Fluviicoccus sp.]|nr:NAD(P)-dependent oxidoreductase [Fluviicoccus sp.]
MSLKNQTVFITGASRGIGRAIALRCARDGANVVIAAKSEEPHPKLGGSIHTVAAEVEAAGGKALAIALDVRDEASVRDALAKAAEHFGGIDILINNAGALSLSNVENTPLKKYDLIQSINSRAVFVCSQAALPYLKKSSNGHILSLSPPINLNPKWLTIFAPYTLSKYGMTLLSIGMAQEFKDYGICVNTLWPETYIATAAVTNNIANDEAVDVCRKPEIMADAAWTILTSRRTGQNEIDEGV